MTPIPRRLAVALVLVLAAHVAGAQQGYDPMAAARGAPALLPGAAPAPEAAPAVPGNPDYGDLPDAPGVEDTYYQCVACHSTAIIRQQHLTDARWDYLWGWMVEEQGMPEAEPEVRETILAYLKTHFSSER